MKYKLLTEEQILISIDRLTRFKETKQKYLRVYSDILVSNLIEPKLKKVEIIKEYIVMAFGALCVAVAVNFFMVPGNLVFGSASGLSLVLTQIIPIKMSMMNMCINIFFLYNKISIYYTFA